MKIYVFLEKNIFNPKSHSDIINFFKTNYVVFENSMIESTIDFINKNSNTDNIKF